VYSVAVTVQGDAGRLDVDLGWRRKRSRWGGGIIGIEGQHIAVNAAKELKDDRRVNKMLYGDNEHVLRNGRPWDGCLVNADFEHTIRLAFCHFRDIRRSVWTNPTAARRKA
jgi:hypothetical protein